MNIRLLLLSASLASLVLGCSSTDPEPAPAAAPLTHRDGPPVDEGAPVTGGTLFNGN